MPQKFKLTAPDGRSYVVNWDKPSPPTPDDVDRIYADIQDQFGSRQSSANVSILSALDREQGRKARESLSLGMPSATDFTMLGKQPPQPTSIPADPRVRAKQARQDAEVAAQAQNELATMPLAFRPGKTSADEILGQQASQAKVAHAQAIVGTTPAYTLQNAMAEYDIRFPDASDKERYRVKQAIIERAMNNRFVQYAVQNHGESLFEAAFTKGKKYDQAMKRYKDVSKESADYLKKGGPYWLNAAVAPFANSPEAQDYHPMSKQAWLDAVNESHANIKGFLNDHLPDWAVPFVGNALGSTAANTYHFAQEGGFSGKGDKQKLKDIFLDSAASTLNYPVDVAGDVGVLISSDGSPLDRLGAAANIILKTDPALALKPFSKVAGEAFGFSRSLKATVSDAINEGAMSLDDTVRVPPVLSPAEQYAMANWRQTLAGSIETLGEQMKGADRQTRSRIKALRSQMQKALAADQPPALLMDILKEEHAKLAPEGTPPPVIEPEQPNPLHGELDSLGARGVHPDVIDHIGEVHDLGVDTAPLRALASKLADSGLGPEAQKVAFNWLAANGIDEPELVARAIQEFKAADEAGEALTLGHPDNIGHDIYRANTPDAHPQLQAIADEATVLKAGGDAEASKLIQAARTAERNANEVERAYEAAKNQHGSILSPDQDAAFQQRVKAARRYSQDQWGAYYDHMDHLRGAAHAEPKPIASESQEASPEPTAQEQAPAAHNNVGSDATVTELGAAEPTRSGNGGQPGAKTSTAAALADWRQQSVRPGDSGGHGGPDAAHGQRRGYQAVDTGRRKPGVKATYAPTPEAQKAWSRAVRQDGSQAIHAPVIDELNSTPAGAKKFHAALKAAKDANPSGASVTLYDAKDYKGMRLFLSQDGKSGFALNGDDIVSVFRHPDSQSGVAPSLLQLAVDEGGVRLDCFDTELPHIYGKSGFKAVARLGWVDEFAPADWNAKLYEGYNGGKPDVVFMTYDPLAKPYKLGDGALVQSYDEGVAAQKAALEGKAAGPEPPTGGSSGGEMGKAPTELASTGGGASQSSRILPKAEGGKSKSPHQILNDASKALNKALSVGKSFSRRVLGSYSPGSTRTVSAFFEDVDTAAHELGHALDDDYGLVSSWAKPRVRSPFDKELEQFWVHTSRKGYSLAQRRAEGVAEFLRAYAFDPDEARRLAPNFAKHYEATVPPKVRSAWDAFGKDVRTWAGASDLEKVKHSIAFDKPDEGLVQRVVNFFRPDGPGYATSGASYLKRLFTDELDPFVKAVEETMQRRGVGNLLPEDNPVLLARMHGYFKSRFANMLEHGMVDARGNRVGKPIAHILEPLNSKSMKALNEDLQDMLALATSERAIEKIVDLSDERIVNFGAGIYKNSDIAAGAIAELKANPERFKALTESVNRYREWADDVLKYARDKGLISDAKYTEIKASNQYYANMQRVMDDVAATKAGGGSKLGSGKQGVRRMKGSSRRIQSPLVGLVEDGYRLVKEADSNEVLRKFRDLLTTDRPMYDGKPVDLASIGRRVPSTEKGSKVTIYVDGKPETWKFEPGVERALKGVGDFYSMGNLEKLLSFPARLVRGAVTNSPGFMIRNRIRDIGERLVKTTTGSNLGRDTFGRISEAEASNYTLYGGGIGHGKLLDTELDFYRVQKKLISEAAQDKKSLLLMPLEFWSGLGEASERAGRVAEIRSALREAERLGLDDYNAQLYAHAKSRELIDFARAGSLVKFVNRYIPFTNAKVQGLSRTMTVLKNEPVKFTARWAGYVLLPTMATYAWNYAQGPEVMEEYRQLPTYVRQSFYNFKVQGIGWVRIPKPFELGTLGTGVEYAVDKSLGNPSAGDGFGGDMARSMLPMDESAIVGGWMRPVVENWTNYDFFKRSNVIPDYEDDLFLSERKGAEKGSRLGQLIGYSVGLDPRKVDHLIDSQLGDFGDAAMAASDTGRTDKRFSAARGLNLATGLFTDTPAFNAVDVQWVLEQARGAGLRGVLKDQITAVFDAQTSRERDLAARDLRTQATSLRRLIEQTTKGLRGKDYAEAVRASLK